MNTCQLRYKMLVYKSEVKMAAKYRDYSYTAKREYRKKVIFIVSLVIFVFSVYTLITSFLIKTYIIQSDAMSPEILHGEAVLITPIYKPESYAKRGNVIVLSPAYEDKRSFFQKAADKFFGFFTFQMFRPFENRAGQGTANVIRRLVGLPGDTVYMENFILHIKTENAEHFLTEFELAEIDYNLEIQELPAGWNSKLPFSGTYPETTLKENEYFLLCDNRIISDDSRLWGPVDGKKRICGNVLFKYWPFGAFKLYQ